jgi:hypothetical protein
MLVKKFPEFYAMQIYLLSNVVNRSDYMVSNDDK